MIKKLRLRFIALSMISLFILLALIVAAMNTINYINMTDDADTILELLSENKGRFPELNGFPGAFLPPYLSPETAYESRYFSVLVDSARAIIQIDTSRIFAINEIQAIRYAEIALSSKNTKGFVGDFRYISFSEDNLIRVTFLDCGRKLDSWQSFLFVSIAMTLVGLLIVFFVILFFSERILRPVKESYEKQKRFITDAGHEIKTPLTIISANADVLQMDIGENECLQDIKQQTKRLSDLTHDLVYLARMEESENKTPMVEFPISDVIIETLSEFNVLALSSGKEIESNIQPMLSVHGNSEAVHELLSILLDNALKYSPEGGLITVSLTKHARAVHLSISNTVCDKLSNDELEHIFDRFYRTDKSRNSETGGHGIGLSIAKAIMNAHNGKIQASAQSENVFMISCIFPA